jgi:hypothetical protein
MRGARLNVRNASSPNDTAGRCQPGHLPARPRRYSMKPKIARAPDGRIRGPLPRQLDEGSFGVAPYRQP